MRLDIQLVARRSAFILASIAICLALISIALKTYEYALPLNQSNYFIFNVSLLFNINREENIPTWYASCLLLTSAVLLAVIALMHHRNQAPYRRHWTFLCLIFLYLSLDETAVIHETLTQPLQETFNTQGFLYFSWVIVGAVFVLVVGFAYVRFVLDLPRLTRNLFLLAGALYIGGALGIEIISANIWYQAGGTSLLFSAVGAVEELLEMLGVVVFIYALLRHIADAIPEISLTVVPKQSK